jgi:hypothetical protein
MLTSQNVRKTDEKIVKELEDFIGVAPVEFKRAVE